jgi:WD40 repeat protein
MTPVEIAWPMDDRPDWLKLEGIGSSAFALSTTERAGVQILELTNLSLSGNGQNRAKILVQEPFVSMRTASMSWANDKLAVSVTLASASLESSVIVYDITEDFLTTFKKPGVAFDSPTWSPDGQWLALTEKDRQFAIVLMRLTDGCEVRQSLPSIGGPTGLSWSRDGSTLALSYPARVYVLPFSAVFGFEYSGLEENCTFSE